MKESSYITLSAVSRDLLPSGLMQVKNAYSTLVDLNLQDKNVCKDLYEKAFINLKLS